jgi:hypothetical protein
LLFTHDPCWKALRTFWLTVCDLGLLVECLDPLIHAYREVPRLAVPDWERQVGTQNFGYGS